MQRKKSDFAAVKTIRQNVGNGLATLTLGSRFWVLQPVATRKIDGLIRRLFNAAAGVVRMLRASLSLSVLFVWRVPDDHAQLD